MKVDLTGWVRMGLVVRIANNLFPPVSFTVPEKVNNRIKHRNKMYIHIFKRLIIIRIFLYAYFKRIIRLRITLAL